MRVLVDTHLVLDLLKDSLVAHRPAMARRLAEPSVVAFISVASLWEIAIKTRLGKLDPGMALDQLATWVERLGLRTLPVETRHVVAAAEPEPTTRDPFDRLLLAICQVDGLRLATVDQALVAHPLALR